MSPTIKGGQIRDETIETNDIKDNTIEGQDVNPTGSFTMGALGLGTSPSNYTLEVAGPAGFDEYIIHNGDTDTYIQLVDDAIHIVAGGRQMIKFVQDSTEKITINNGGMDVDLQIKGENDANLIRTDAANDRVGIGTSAADCTLNVAGAFAASGPSKTFVTFGATDATPSVAAGNLFKTGGMVMFTDFDDGVAGQIITIISAHSGMFDVTDTNLKGGTTDISYASGDVTTWIYDGTYWYLMNFMDQSADLSGGH